MALTVAERYNEVRRLGAGGMASVCLAEDTVLGREVALKRVRGTGDQRAVERLRREARVGASLNHHNLVAVYDVLVEDDDLVIVMEYVAGEDLRDALGRGRLEPGRVIEVVGAVAAGLDHAHRHGVIHRDVKPANILLGSSVVKLSDLGIALALSLNESRLTISGAVVGSAAYMSPEQFENAEITPATDVYALAAVAFEALAGRRARPETGPVAIARAALTRPPDLREAWPAAPPEAARVLRRGLDPDPARRHPSAGELAAELAATLSPTDGRRGPSVAPAIEDPATTATQPAIRRDPPPPSRATNGRPSRRPVPAARAKAPAVQKAPPATPPPPAAARPARTASRRPRWLVLALLAVAVAAVAVAVVLASSGGSSSPPSPTGGGAKRTASKKSSGGGAGGRGAASGGGAAAAPDPAAAVRAFYTDQAAHRFGPAWALATDNLRAELGGRSSFEGGSSTLRSITFDDLNTTSSSGDAATVSLRTTATHTDHVDHCTGTADLVKSGDAWLVDRLGITC